MNYKGILEEANSNQNYKVQHINIGDIQTAEIYDTRNNNLDYVVMYFKFNLSNCTEIENKINEYRKNDETCIIGCINSLEIEYSAFKNLISLFDVQLDAATNSDFENLIDFCISTEDSFIHIDSNVFKSNPGTEVFVVTEQNKSINRLIDNLKASSNKILEHHEKKFPKVVISLMTNNRELLLSEVKEIMDSLADFLVEDAQCMWNSCECMKDLKENEIKIMVIYFEKDNNNKPSS